MINAEIAVTPGDLFVGFFDAGDFGESRAGNEFIFELIHRVTVALGNDFDAPVRQVADGTMYLMPRGGAHGEEAKAYALHKTGDDETTSDHDIT